MKDMHSLLKRQLKRFFGDFDHIPQELKEFISTVNDAYKEFDTDREMLERSLELSSQEMLQTNAELRAILSALPDIIFIIDSDGTIIDCESYDNNDLIFKTKDKIIGKKIQNAHFLEKGQIFLDAIEKVNHTKTVTGFEYTLQIKNKLNHYEARLVPFIEKQLIVIIRNITDRKNADQALRKQEERFRSLIEKATDLITIIDSDGTILYESPSSEAILGYKPEELVGQNSLSFLHTDDVSLALETLHPNSVYTPIDSIEVRFRHKDGTWRYLEAMGQDLRDQSDIGGILINSRDITERKLAEDAHRMSELFYRTIFENTGTAMVMIDENGLISLANKKVEELTGYTTEELLCAHHWSIFLTNESLETITVNRLDLGSEYLANKLNYDLQISRKDGSLREVLITLNNIPGTGRIIGSLLDLTDIKKAQKDLQESEEKYRVLIENATGGIFVIQDSTIKFPNLNTINALGYSEEELARMPFTSLIHPDDMNDAMAAFNNQIANNIPPVPINFRIITKSGEERWAEVMAVSTFWQGEEAVICFVRDITQQRKLEHQLLQAQKMEAIGTLAGGIAHDFNNLLMGIQGYASIMLLDEGRSPSDNEMLKAIEEQVRSGADLTKQLLGFARAGKYEPKNTNFNELLQRTSNIFSRTRKEITVHMKGADDLWTVNIDRGQIEQCLLNLYVNAWQAMPGGGCLYLETENLFLDGIHASSLDLKPGQYIKISVTDTGIGMDKKTKERIFEPFFTTKEMGRGTGLGLASVYGIITNHKGIILVESEKGQGTTFSIYLPAIDTEAIEEKTISKGILTGIETILLVEDEQIVSDVTSKVLMKLGYKVLAAQSGKKAIELYQDHKTEINLVILDMIMPGMSGEETYAALKTIDPTVNVVLSSGYSMNAQITELLEKGCLDFFQKPFEINDLSQRLRKILDNS